MDVLHKISAEEAAKIASSVNTGPKIIQWRTKRLTVRPLLQLNETIKIVNNVMNACIDQSTGCFIPEMIDYALRFQIVSMYACVEMPEDMRLQYILLYATDLYDTVLNAVNKNQIDAIKNAVSICANGMMRRQED